MISIAIYGTCQEMHVNGPQNTLPTLSVASSTLVLSVEGITTQLVAMPAMTRLAVTSIARLTVAAVMVYVPYFMQSSTDHWFNEPEKMNKYDVSANAFNKYFSASNIILGREKTLPFTFYILISCNKV